MPAETPVYKLPYPVASDVPDVPADMRKLAEAIDLALANVYAIMPLGTILALAAGAAIPSGWALCDGQNGRPNLAGKTLVGAGTATDGTHLASGQLTAYSAGQYGGTASVKLTDVTSGIGIHQHNGQTTVNIPPHVHTVPQQVVTSGTESKDHTHTGSTAGMMHGQNRYHAHTVWGGQGITNWMSQNNVHHHGAYTAGGGGHGHQVRVLEGNAKDATDGVGLDSSPQQGGWNPYGISGETVGGGDHDHPVGTHNTDINHYHPVYIDASDIEHAHAFDTSSQIWSGSAGHTHNTTIPASTTLSAAPAAGGTVSMEESQPKDAQQPHENRMPYYVVNYIIRVA